MHRAKISKSAIVPFITKIGETIGVT